MDQNQIKRINELFHKEKLTGLTPEEKDEQQRLRKDYIANIKSNMRNQLNNISIVESDGSITDLGKTHKN